MLMKSFVKCNSSCSSLYQNECYLNVDSIFDAENIVAVTTKLSRTAQVNLGFFIS
jgi:hypothetical protein